VSVEYRKSEKRPLPDRRQRQQHIASAERDTRRNSERAQKAEAKESARRQAKKAPRKRNWVSTLLLLIGFCLMGYALWELGQIWWKYYSADKNYSQLTNNFTTPMPDNNGEGADDAMLIAARERRIDFDGLREINPDIVGWIFIPDTRIDYPIVHTDNNDYYLKTDFHGNYSDGGTVFLEASNKPDFSDYESRIYGHNMYDRSMFGELPFYRKPDFAQSHQHVFLYLPHETREYLLVDQGVVTPDGLEPAPTDIADAMFLTLVTCEYDFDDARYFIRVSRVYVYKPGGEKIWSMPENTEAPAEPDASVEQ